VIVEIRDPPFAHAGEVGVPECQRCAHTGLAGKIVEVDFGLGQEAFGNFQARP